MNTEDTICALSTAPGSAAVAMIRISGKDAIESCNALFRPANKSKSLSKVEGNTLVYGTFSDIENDIDDLIAAVFKAPHSFTGEDTVELTCHGSSHVQQRILECLVKQGIRMAKPGEYTMRAFLNGKMDLSQAEAVADLIATQTESQHKMAFNQMRGGFSSEIKVLRDKLLNFASLIELELDFSEEEVEFADRERLNHLLDNIEDTVTTLTRSFKYGNSIKNGLPVSIIGKTNSGKSTLLNKILKEEKAIVSEVEGTTRDFIEDTMIVNGVLFRFIDTAGLRKTTDSIEIMGIERSMAKYEQSEIVIAMVDLTDSFENTLKTFEFIKDAEDTSKHIIFALNKIDLISEKELHEYYKLIIKHFAFANNIIDISAKNSVGLKDIEKSLYNYVDNKKKGAEDVVVTNIRHYEALKQVQESICRIRQNIADEIPTDLMAFDLREAIHYLGEITGEITNDEVLGNIFKNFCIGK